MTFLGLEPLLALLRSQVKLKWYYSKDLLDPLIGDVQHLKHVTLKIWLTVMSKSANFSHWRYSNDFFMH